MSDISAAELMTVSGVRSSWETAVTKIHLQLGKPWARVLVNIRIAILITSKKRTPKLIARSRRC